MKVLNKTTGRKSVRVGMLHRCWLSFSLKKKVQFLTGTVGAAVLLSITVSLLVSGFGMMEFGAILDSTSRSLKFWSSMESEDRAFSNYVRDQSSENREVLTLACQKTAEALQALPFDYQKIGSERYAKTWSIRNGYEVYAKNRDELLNRSDQGEAYVEELYRIYRMQQYIKSYAGSLEQMNVEAGNHRYGNLLPLFFLLPAAVVILGLITVVVILWMRHSMNRDFIKPVLTMAEESRRIAVNDFGGPDFSGEVPPPADWERQVESRDEIGELTVAFQKMKEATQGYIITLKEKHRMEKQLDDVRLQMLKNQINPHFLFNTLNMIASMAQIEEAETTERMIICMSSLFRYNLKSTDSVMPLERELKVVEDYMYLQQMRFGERLLCSVDCSPDTMEILVPSFALQPLVENAIIHGISGKVQGGKIHIRSWLKGKQLWISVADTGCGIKKEKLEAILRALENGEEGHTGVGIGNIYRRISAMYTDGEVHMYSQEGCGTVIQLAFTEGGDGYVSGTGSG